MFDLVLAQFDTVRTMYNAARGVGRKEDSLEVVFKVRGL